MWVLLRQKDVAGKSNSIYKVLPITIRSLETLIRLSTAHAKLRQSKEVQIKDCVEAFRLVTSCIEDNEHALDK